MMFLVYTRKGNTKGIQNDLKEQIYHPAKWQAIVGKRTFAHIEARIQVADSQLDHISDFVF